MPSYNLINYPPLCAATALSTLPSPEWCPVPGTGKRTGSPQNEKSLLPEAGNTLEQLFIPASVLCSLPHLLAIPITIIKSGQVCLVTMASHKEVLGKMLSLPSDAYGGHPEQYIRGFKIRTKYHDQEANP